jgi:hypothetical protein
MPVQYTNRKNFVYYLHEGKTKKGNPKYFLSTKTEGDLVDSIPTGYEIYENPNAQVFLRKIQPKLIADLEKALVEKYLKKLKVDKSYVIYIKGKYITIHEAENMGFIAEDFSKHYLVDIPGLNEFVMNSSPYMQVMRFLLDDMEKRTFIAERYCFKGSVYDWMFIGGPDSLEKLLKEYTKHLEKESFFDLY